MNCARTVLVAAVLIHLGACGGSGGGGIRPVVPVEPPEPPPELTPADPEYHLQTERFTTHQPQVLEQIGAHHAYAKGLTGRGVRIGIEDSVVDYTQTGEFGNRMRVLAADGAHLAYDREAIPGGSIHGCITHGTCGVVERNSQGDPEAVNRWVREIVGEVGWPERENSLFIHDTYDGSWYEVAALYANGQSHGTSVASTAAGTDLGVAPSATVIPVGVHLGPDSGEGVIVEAFILENLRAMTPEARAALDREAANEQRAYYAHFDIINQSYGGGGTIASAIDVDTKREYEELLPELLRAFLQTDRRAEERVVHVRAAGNCGAVNPVCPIAETTPQGEATWPYHHREVRGHTVVVAATDPTTGLRARYSNPCGPLPPDWSAAAHGPHYCLAAPGTVRGLVPDPGSPGRGRVDDGVGGTSFAAPVVSGALALMLEYFRGTRGNTAIVRRMLDTADRSGVYAQSEIYGAGHLDLEAALSPVGTLTAGQERQALSRTTLQTPMAFGSVTERLGETELATFDAQGFPFWVPASELVSSRGPGRSPIPELSAPSEDAPGAGLDALGMHWAVDRHHARIGPRAHRTRLRADVGEHREAGRRAPVGLRRKLRLWRLPRRDRARGVRHRAALGARVDIAELRPRPRRRARVRGDRHARRRRARLRRRRDVRGVAVADDRRSDAHRDGVHGPHHRAAASRRVRHRDLPARNGMDRGRAAAAHRTPSAVGARGARAAHDGTARTRRGRRAARGRALGGVRRSARARGTRRSVGAVWRITW